MNEFVEECRREWQLLGVPDPIASEMAVDLSIDIEEAEAEGGSAEDVLGTSLFDPRGFAADWARARGVAAQRVAAAPTAPSTPTSPSGPRTPSFLDRFSSRRWPVLAGGLTLLVVLVGMVALAGAVVVGRNSSAVAAPAQRILRLPGSPRLFVPSPATPHAPYLLPGPLLSVSHGGFAPLAVAVLAVFLVGLGVAILGWFLWCRRHPWRGNR